MRAQFCSRCEAPDGVTVFRRDVDRAWFDTNLKWRGHDGRVVGDGSVATNNPHYLESVGKCRPVAIALNQVRVAGQGVVALCSCCAEKHHEAEAIARRSAKRNRSASAPALRDLFPTRAT